jgi:hypothetical protein
MLRYRQSQLRRPADLRLFPQEEEALEVAAQAPGRLGKKA